MGLHFKAVLSPKLQVFFAHRRLPMGKKKNSLCVLRASVVKISLILIIIFLLPSLLSAKREHPEKWYQEKWCEAHKGQVEVVLPDGTRCDCVTDTHAIEFDFGNNWAEAVGQSAYYSLQTRKKPGVVLILEKIKDRKYWIRLNTTIEHFNLPIDTWKVGNASY
jgi:hypothetical protein